MQKEYLIQSFKLRRRYFDTLIDENNINLCTCPSCGYPTLRERNVFEICPICNWEDDGQDDFNSLEILGGPNKYLSLNESRIIFEEKNNLLLAKGVKILNFINQNIDSGITVNLLKNELEIK